MASAPMRLLAAALLVCCSLQSAEALRPPQEDMRRTSSASFTESRGRRSWRRKNRCLCSGQDKPPINKEALLAWAKEHPQSKLVNVQEQLAADEQQLRNLLRLRVVAEHKCKARDALNADKIWVHFQVCPAEVDSGYCCRVGDKDVELPVDKDVVAPAATPESKISHLRAFNKKVDQNTRDTTIEVRAVTSAVVAVAEKDKSAPGADTLNQAQRRASIQIEQLGRIEMLCRMDMSNLAMCQDPFAFLVGIQIMLEDLKASRDHLKKGLACLNAVKRPLGEVVTDSAKAVGRGGLRVARMLWRSRYLMMAGVVAYQGVEPLIAELKAAGVDSMLRNDVAAAFPVVMEGLVKHIACPILYHPMLMMKLVQATIQHLLTNTAGFLAFLQSRFDAKAINAVKDAVDGVRELNGAGAAAESAYALLATFAHDFWISVASAVCPQGAGLPAAVPAQSSSKWRQAKADEASRVKEPITQPSTAKAPPRVDRPKRALPQEEAPRPPKSSPLPPKASPPSPKEASNEGPSVMSWLSGTGFSDMCLRSSEEICATQAKSVEAGEGGRSWFGGGGGGGGDASAKAGADKVSKAVHEAKKGMPMAGLSGHTVYGKNHIKGPDTVDVQVNKQGMTVAGLSGWTVHGKAMKAIPQPGEAAPQGRHNLMQSFVHLFKSQKDDPSGARTHSSFWGGVNAEQIARRLNRGRIPAMPGTIVNDHEGNLHRLGLKDEFEGLRIMDAALVELEGAKNASSLLDAEHEARETGAALDIDMISVEEFMQKAENMNLLSTLLVATFDSFSAFFPSDGQSDTITEVTQKVAMGEGAGLGLLKMGEVCEIDSDCEGDFLSVCVEPLDDQGHFKEGPKTCTDFTNGDELTLTSSKEMSKLIIVHVRNLAERACEETAPET